MTTCACCGQNIPSSGRLTVRVDDDLLMLCNQAYAEAGRRGASGVEIAHVVWCLTASAGASRWFEGVGLLRLSLATAVDRWLARVGRDGAPAALQASDELKVLLTRTEAMADREAKGFAGPRDFLIVVGRREDIARFYEPG